jgi:hypothetical protein
MITKLVMGLNLGFGSDKRRCKAIRTTQRGLFDLDLEEPKLNLLNNFQCEFPIKPAIGKRPVRVLTSNQADGHEILYCLLSAERHWNNFGFSANNTWCPL